MREATLAVMLPGLRETVRGRWWDVPWARYGVILLDRLAQPPPALERIVEELCLYLQAAGVTVLRVDTMPAGGRDDLGAHALLVAVRALRARGVERTALLAPSHLTPRPPRRAGEGKVGPGNLSPWPLAADAPPRRPSEGRSPLPAGPVPLERGRGVEGDGLPGRLFWNLIEAALGGARDPQEITQRLADAIGMARHTVDAIRGVAWLLVPPPQSKISRMARERGSARGPAFAATLDDGDGAHEGALPSLRVRLPADDAAGAVLPAIERLYAWTLAVLREEPHQMEPAERRWSDTPAHAGLRQQRGRGAGKDSLDGAYGERSTSSAVWLARRWHEILCQLKERAPERASAIWRRARRASEEHGVGYACDPGVAALMAWPLLDAQARFDWLDASGRALRGEVERAQEVALAFQRRHA